jgi:thiol-disulfide isomerase/thioredoxin
MTISRRTMLMAGAALPGTLTFPQLTNAQVFSAEGRYEVLPTPQPTTNPDKVEVVEVFWYGCPHCNRFQPHIEPWQANIAEHVEFHRMPAIFRKIGKCTLGRTTPQSRWIRSIEPTR